jgi:hypothetical protein
MQLRAFSLAVIAACLLLVCPLAATPIYNVSSGTLTYSNSYLGFGLTNSFTFTGLQPVSIQGSGATAIAYSALENANVPFNLTLGLIIDDTGNESGPASANGTSYGSSEYITVTLATLSNSSPITLTAGHLTTSVPAVISGEYTLTSAIFTTPVPEPATWLLVVCGAALMMARVAQFKGKS